MNITIIGSPIEANRIEQKIYATHLQINFISEVVSEPIYNPAIKELAKPVFMIDGVVYSQGQEPATNDIAAYITHSLIGVSTTSM